MKKVLITGTLMLLIGVPVYLWFFVSKSPSISLTPVPKALGPKNTINIVVTTPNGFREVRAALHQGASVAAAQQERPATRFLLSPGSQPPQQVALQLSLDPKIFKPGPATLTVDATSNDLRAVSANQQFPVDLVFAPPKVSADSLQHYINQGGAELVTFDVSGTWDEAGVRIGPYSFRSFQRPGSKSPNERFSLFVWPWDVPAGSTPVVFATNAAGQEAIATFWFKLFPKKFRKRDLELEDAFLNKVVPAIDPNGAGDTLHRFLKINGDLRRANNATLKSLRDKSEQRFLWESPFQQLSNSQVEAQFADVRSYMYQGKKVDEQVHLGFDLSKTQHSPVVASNSGKVIYAGPLGIYGNCVVVDHGYGLQSIYGHLSEIGVKENQMVARGESLGKSGETGLAGGDHLHYSMQIDGVQTNPVEWWDPHWIQDRVSSKVPVKP